MDEKTLHTLEFLKILERLASYASFSGSAESALALRPTVDIDEARLRQQETSEAIGLLTTHPDLTIGGVRDVRPSVDLANHGGVLTSVELLDIKSTLIASRNLARTFDRLKDQYPTLYAIVSQLPPPLGLVDAITRAISERGEILDSASEKLSNIRRDMRIAHDRLLTKLQRMITDPKTTPYLQEALITQRDGRYVIPLRAEFKGKLRAVVHDQSASGATLFIEPLPVVDLNNEYRELQLAERDEERRILAELSANVAFHAVEITSIIDIISDFDLALAKAKYADDLAATEPRLHSFRGAGTPHHPGSIIRLYQARHPLLDPKIVVPIDVELDPQTFALVITGPNTGGKTVTLKTVGLLALMAQAGLHIPAHSGSEISIFHDIYADICDEQSIEQSLSTFSGHITNIIRILEHADSHSLVLLDELGAGTDPQEGAALARALLSHILERRITILVTTHHPELKTYAHATPGVVNASVEFDLETLQPTYHLTIGLPGRSNALAIAQRLGMPDAIIEAGRSELHPDELRSESLLDEIHRQRDLSRQARHHADKARHEAEALRAELSGRLEKIEDERRSILEQAHQEAEAQLSELEEELRQTRHLLARSRQPVESLREVEDRLETLQEAYDHPVERLPVTLGPGGSPASSRLPRLGDKVRLRTLGTYGIVTALGEEEVEVQVGVLRVRARLADLETAGESPEASSPAKQAAGSPSKVGTKKQSELFAPSPGVELDLRGQRAEDALDALDRYLDAAYLAGLPFVRIIHGKGTGKLRQAVREALSSHPHVKSWEAGGDKEGGEGVTVAKLVAN